MSKQLLFCWALLAVLCLPMSLWARGEEADSEEPERQPIQLTFVGVGDSETVESVWIENLSQPGEEVELTGSDILVLNAKGTGIEEVVAGNGGVITDPLLYPNPAEGDGNLVFDVKADGEVRVSICTLAGAVVDAATVPVVKGRNSIRIPAQGYGFFMVHLEGNGVNFTDKWMSGAEPSFSGIQHNGVSSVELPIAQIKETRAEAPTKTYLKFNPGDLLRMTAISGKMKNIVLQRPTVSHTVTFQFFKCEDADGYNYPTIEVGGMLWMAEDLRVVKNAGVPIWISGEAWADPAAGELKVAYENFDEANADKGGYYTVISAQKAMPEGWRCPSFEQLQKALDVLGGDSIAGGKMKSRDEDGGWTRPDSIGLDEIQLNLAASGCLTETGQWAGKNSETYVVTRSSAGGTKMMRITDADDKAVLDMALVAASKAGYRFRGVHDAVSNYGGFISQWLKEHPEDKPQNICTRGLEGNPFAYTAPLGARFTIPANGVEVVGLGGVWTKEAAIKNLKDLKFKSLGGIPENTNTSICYVGQNMPNGKQRIVEVSIPNKSSTATLKVYQDNGSEYVTVCEQTFSGHIPGYSISVSVTDKNFETESPTYFTEMMESEMSLLQVHCADFNADGTDDVLVAVGGTMTIFDGTDYQTVLLTKKVDAYARFSVEDINMDGLPDVAMTYAADGNICLDVYWDGLEAMNGDCSMQKIVGPATNFHSPLIGDINADGIMEILTYQRNLAGDKVTIGTQFYDRENKTLVDGEKTEITLEKGYKHSNSMMKFVKTRGMALAPDVVADGMVLRWANGRYEVIYTFPKSETYHSNSIATGNFDGNKEGTEQIIALCAYTESYYDSMWEGLRTDITFFYRFFYVDAEKGQFVAKNGFEIGLGGSSTLNQEFVDDEMWADTWTPGFMACGVARVTSALRELQLDRVETTMTEPRIYALLSAAPYWSEYVDSYPDSPSTSWGYSSASGSGGGNTSTHTAKVILGYENETTIPLIGTFGFEAELQLSRSWTDAYENMETTEFGVDYTTYYDDAVVMQLTPFTTYIYKVIQSDNPGERGSEIVVGVPDKPRNMPLTLEDYMLLRADNADIPDLSQLLKHTPGNPWSYREAYVDELPVYGEILWGKNNKYDWQDVGSGAAVTRSVSVTTESMTTTENEYDLDASLVSKTLGVTVGGGYGYNNTNSTSHMESEGHTITGAVVAPRNLSDGSAKNFRWNVFRANVNFGKQKFPMVGYIVTQ